MKIDIGFIITKDYLPNLKTVEQQLIESCNFHYYLIENFIDIKTNYQRYYHDIDAFVFSNPFIYRLLENEIGTIDKPFYIITDDISNIYKQLLTIFLKNRELNSSRVYIDFTTTDVDLAFQEIFPKDQMPYLLPLDLSKQSTPAEIVLNNHKKLWDENKIDLSITRFGMIIDELGEEGIKYEFIQPSFKHIEKLLTEVIKDIRFDKLNRNKLAVISIEFFHKKTSIDANYELEIKNLKLLGEIEEFAKNNAFDFLIDKNASRIEILTTIEDLIKLTDNFSSSSFQNYLEKKLDESISIGYGTGKNFSQARENSSKALIHSNEYHKGLSVVVYANQKTTTLSGQDIISYTQKPSSKIIDLSKKLDISNIYLQKIIGYCEKMNKNKVYSKEISTLLGVTERTANRTLNRIVDNKGAEVSTEQRDNAKGRPTKFYILNFIDENGIFQY